MEFLVAKVILEKKSETVQPATGNNIGILTEIPSLIVSTLSTEPRTISLEEFAQPAIGHTAPKPSKICKRGAEPSSPPT